MKELLKTAISWLGDFLSSYKIPVTIVLGIATGAFCAYGGYKYAKAQGDATIARLEASLAEQQAKERTEYEKRLVDTINERDSALTRLGLDRNRIESLRSELLDANRRESERVASNPDKSYKDEYERSRELLRESLELNVEGCYKLRECAIDKDAVVKLLNP